MIVCDFIDMRNEKHRQGVERAFRQAVRADRARSRILKISRFGIVEMTRQRMRPSLQSSTYLACPQCAGSGFVKSHESVAIEVIRLLNLAASQKQISRIELLVAEFLQNEKRASIAQIEQAGEKKIVIRAEPAYTSDKHQFICYNERGSVVSL